MYHQPLITTKWTIITYQQCRVPTEGLWSVNIVYWRCQPGYLVIVQRSLDVFHEARYVVPRSCIWYVLSDPGMMKSALDHRLADLARRRLPCLKVHRKKGSIDFFETDLALQHGLDSFRVVEVDEAASSALSLRLRASPTIHQSDKQIREADVTLEDAVDVSEPMSFQ